MKYIIFSFVICSIFSCEKLIIDRGPKNTPTDVFEVFWTNLDEKYAYFAQKNIDWDSMYHVTRPMIYNGMADDELWEVLSEMFCVLKDDGHVSLSGDGRYTKWNACQRKIYHRNFDFNLVTSNYLGYPLKYSGPLLYGKIGNIGYIFYSSFMNTVNDADIDFVIGHFMDTRGIIIDIRDNQGGSDGNGNLIQSRLLEAKTLVEKVYYKNGPGHHDFTLHQNLYISPAGAQQYTKPVAVLTNRYCYSAASNFASRMSVLPHVSIIGDTTLGGAGRPKYFDLPNGWKVRYSSNYALRPDGYDYEGGVPVDQYVAMEDVDKMKGKDSIIEFAIVWINSQ